MTYIGLIVESPSKCGKIEGYLGDDYKCIASYGHLREIKHLKDIHLKSFKIKYSIIDKKREQINKLKNFIKNASEIVLATDDDREGEAIAWHICDMFNLSIKDTKRIIFNEITKEDSWVLGGLQLDKSEESYRNTGRTTRLIGLYIDDLFTYGKTNEVKDHYKFV